MPTEYVVTLYFQAPAYDERSGIPFIVNASNKREAVERARRESERNGHTPCVGKGRYKFVARECN